MTEVAVIMAGGYGERFWPMSRRSKPKQFLNFFSDESMIRETFLRVNSFIPVEQVFIVTGEEYKEQIQEELPEIELENYIIEPMRRDTAPAIALSAIYVEKRFPGALMFICPSDHIIDDLLQFREIIKNAFVIAKETSCLLTIGIKTTRVETGYGYIKIGEMISRKGKIEGYEVKQFVEKPNYNKASQYIKSGDYLWNSGMFIWETQTFLEELSRFLPETYSGMLEIGESLGKKEEAEVKEKVFETLTKISIDYGVMEKSKNILCIKGDFAWDDVGSWSSLYRFLNKDENNNIQSGQVEVLDTENTIVLGDQKTFIGVVGVKDLIIIKSKDAILICNRNQEEKVKKLVEQMRKAPGNDKFL